MLAIQLRFRIISRPESDNNGHQKETAVAQKMALGAVHIESSTESARCVVCGSAMHGGIKVWHSECKKCGYESGKLEPAINDGAAHLEIDESDREAGLRAIRTENFREIVGLIASNLPARANRLLDVGAAHGWFLEQASRRFTALGIEPDEAVGSKTAQRGLPIRAGYFPQVLEPGEKFDAIVFNDVIEHIPDIETALDACYKHLDADGVLVLNLPNSRGMFYVLSKILARVGWSEPFERMWQKGFPSPHVHFFKSANLATLAKTHGFEILKQLELPSIRRKGLLERMRFSKSASSLTVYLQYLGALAMIPFTRIFPSDVIVCLYRKCKSVN